MPKHYMKKAPKKMTNKKGKKKYKIEYFTERKIPVEEKPQ